MTGPARLATRLARRTRLARLALWWEAAWPALWPPLGVIGLFLVLGLGGLPLVLPGLVHLLLLTGFAAALAWTLRHAWRRLAPPGAGAAQRRLERDSGLDHRPIATLADRPVGEDPVALALWEAHRRRAAARLAALRVAPPRPGLPSRDRRALRGGLAVALVAALGMAGAEAPERLRRAFVPELGGAALPTTPAMRLEAWITPPAYTGAAPVFLEARGGAVAVPAGSRLQVALSGGVGGTPELMLDTEATPFRVLDRSSFAIERGLDTGARLAVRRDGAELAHWSLTVRADAPPTAAWEQSPARAVRGLAVRLPWRAEDDWGLAAIRVELRLKLRPEAEPVVLDLPIPGGSPRSARGAAQPDLSAHPWAGLEVEARLVARDHAGQEGRSEGAFLELPERSFTHPVAQELIALRKALSVDPAGREAARRELDRISANPEAFEHDSGTFLALRAARHRLQRDRRPAAIAEVQEILWDVAVALEEGRTDRTARALAEARQALREALEEQRRDPDRAEEQRAELQRRIEELREAIRRHLEALAERLQRENAEALPYDPQQRLMDQRELDRRTRRIEDAARQGRTEDAERELAELEEMLRALEEGRNMRAEDRQRQQQRQRGQQQMGVVQDMVRRQAEMLDRGHRRADAAERERAQQRRQQPLTRNFQQPPQPPPQAAPNEQQLAESQQDSRIQRALRRALGEVMQQFGDLTGDVPAQLGEADRAMRDSAEALGEGRDARDAQQRAIRALTEGGRQMAQQMHRQFGQGQPGEGEEEDGEGEGMAGGPQGGEGQDQAQEQGPGRDPLGRRTREATGGQDNASDTRVPDEAEQLRTRQLQEELRRRGAERERPPAELDYIERLLRRF